MRIKRPMCVLSLIFMAGIWLFTYMGFGVDISEKAADNTKIVVEGIIEDKVYKNLSNVVYIKCSKQKYIVYLDKQDISDFRIGQAVRVEGKYSNFPMSENIGQFDMRLYYRTRKYEAKIKKAEITHASSDYSVYKDFLYNIKERTKSIYKDNMSPDHFGTISAMVLGDKNDLDDETKTLYQNAGISHILSLSGLHIATVGMFVFSLLIRAGLGTKLSSAISAFIMLSYGIMTGLLTSTFRALIMFTLSIFAKCIGRTYDLLSAVCVSAIIILAENPFYIYDSGFLMSFLSVIGIGMIYPVLNEITDIECISSHKISLYKSQSKTPSKISSGEADSISGRVFNIANAVRQSVCISMSATLATLPVVMNSFYKISRYSILVNILIVPVMSVVLFMGIFGGIAGFIGLHKFALLFLKPVEFLLGFFNIVSGKAGNVPGNMWVTGKPLNIGIIVYIILLMLAFSPLGRKLFEKIIKIITREKHTKKEYVENKYTTKEYDKNKYIKKKYTENKNVINFVYTFLLIAIAVIAISYKPHPDFRIDILSVGQGACNVIYGKDIPTLLVDAGSSDVKNVGKYRVIPNLLAKGIDEIDYLFITHPDEDHISAVKEILSDSTCGIKVKALVFSLTDDEIKKVFDGYNVPIYYFNAGDIISGQNFEIKAVYPKYKNNITWKSVDANENSLVLKITHKPSGFAALFTGDIGRQAEEEILNENLFSDICDISFMTIAHHGSKNSSSEQFIKSTNPLICTISAGKDNSYGHPHKETLNTLNNQGIPYLITYETGEIDVCIDNDKVWVDKYMQ